MANLSKKMKTTSIIFAIAIILVATLGISNTLGMQHYQELDFVTGIVTATALNVREGPSISYKIITQVYKNEYIRVFAKIGNWYVIQTDKDYIGAVNASYVKAIYPNTNNTNNNTNNNTTTAQGLTNDEKETLALINEQRVAARIIGIKCR